MREKVDAATVFAHADKCLTITAEELSCERAWQDGRGLIEIVENVVRHLEKTRHIGVLGRIVELQELLRKRVRK